MRFFKKLYIISRYAYYTEFFSVGQPPMKGILITATLLYEENIYDLSGSRRHHAGSQSGGGRHVYRSHGGIRQSQRPVSHGAGDAPPGGRMAGRHCRSRWLRGKAAVFHLLRHRGGQLGHPGRLLAEPPHRPSHRHHRRGTPRRSQLLPAAGAGGLGGHADSAGQERRHLYRSGSRRRAAGHSTGVRHDGKQ